jgi:hypothetical protein
MMYVKHVCLYSLQALSLSNSLQIVFRNRCRAKEAARDLLAAVEAQHAYIPAFGSAGVTVEKASSSAASASPGVAGVPAFTKATEFKLFGGHARYADAVGLLRYAISPVLLILHVIRCLFVELKLICSPITLFLSFTPAYAQRLLSSTG